MNLSIIYDIVDLNGGMTDVDRLTQLYAALSSVLAYKVPGDIAEVGCNRGHTGAFLQLVNHAESASAPRTLHVYDSFRGLPESSSEDRYLSPGELKTTPEELASVFEKWGAPLPEIHEGWFEETLPSALPAQIAFCYLDADYYESILTGLKHIVPRLAPGGVLIVDDYCDLDFAPRSWPGLPGVKKACDEYFGNLGLAVQPLVGTGDLSFAFYRRPTAS